MSILLEQSAYPNIPAQAESAQSAAIHAAQPILQGVPKLLEYRSEADPDAEFIPKTIAGFVGGSMLMGFCLNMVELIFISKPHSDIGMEIMFRIAVMIGIIGVAASLLLVGLKVRADHTDENLYARHWLNSIGTGAGFAMLAWGPWVLGQHGFTVHRFVAAAVFMAVMSFPAVAAKWTITPHVHLEYPPAN